MRSANWTNGPLSHFPQNKKFNRSTNDENQNRIESSPPAAVEYPERHMDRNSIQHIRGEEAKSKFAQYNSHSY